MQKILIANRGEIALRIIKTCHEMEIETVAIYSDADREMPYVKAASKAIYVGEPPVTKSYLQVEKILAIAKDEKVDAIHPGYGFLSENGGFASSTINEGIIFIGPKPETIELMGDKIVSRQTMEKAGVPVVPGSGNGLKTLEEARSLAETIGYPIMLKASGGGGGIGMMLCENEQALVKSYALTKSRAMAYFGSDEVFIEKYIPNARHVEIQVFGDTHGNIVHLYERDCSIQRRHQKVVEESPSPFLSNDIRKKMYETAIKAAKAVNYTNAGTIEFIVDEQENFYFLEMAKNVPSLPHKDGIRLHALLTPFYDPMIAKCIFYGESRDESLSKAESFFYSLKIEGIKTNAPLFSKILADEDFKNGIYTTNFLAK